MHTQECWIPKSPKYSLHGEILGLKSLSRLPRQFKGRNSKKTSFLAVSHQELIRDQKFWHTPGWYWWYATFYFQLFFLTWSIWWPETFFYFCKITEIMHFHDFGRPLYSPRWSKYPEISPRHLWGSYLKSQSIICNFTKYIFFISANLNPWQ